MKERIEEVGGILAGIKGELKAYFADKSIPLEERWENFRLADEVKAYEEYDGCYWSSSVTDEFDISWYDDFHIDRYQELDTVQMVETFQDWVYDPKYCPKRYKTKVTQDHVERLKEEVLQSGITRWIYEW